MVWSITSVDTMKDSKDTCHPTSSQMSDADIAQGVNLAATLNVTHITVDCGWNYPDYLARWVAAVRATGKSVWFRCQWDEWEGINGASQSLTPDEYLTETVAFIYAHPDLFQPGDILDACPESNNSSYWPTNYGGAGWTNSAPTAGTDALNVFLRSLDTQIQTALQNNGVMGVNTKIHSVDISWANDITKLYPATIAQLGCVTYDSYPEDSSTDPDDCADARYADLLAVMNARPGVPIVIGELGYSDDVDVDDATQDSVLAAEFAMLQTVAPIIGMNYWVAQGTSSSGGYTHIFGNVRGAWTLRPAGARLRDFYYQQIYGTDSATVTLGGEALDIGTPGSRLTVRANTLEIQKAIGQRSTADFAVIDEAGTHHYEQGTPVEIVDDVSGERIFAGVLDSGKELAPAPATLALLHHTVGFADWHYLADKRRITYAAEDTLAGDIFKAIIDAKLAEEGVIYQRGVNMFSAQQSDVESDDMSAFNAGSSVTISQDLTTSTHGSGSLKVITSGGAHTFEQLEVRIAAGLFTPGADVTISAKMKVSSGTPTIRFFLDSDSGAIGSVSNISLSSAWTRFTKTVTLPNPITEILFKLRWDTGGSAQALTVWMDEIQIEEASSASDWELGGLQRSVQDGPVIHEFTANYQKPSDAFDALAKPANFYWQIDENKVAWFVAPGTLPAPWAVTGSQILLAGVGMERKNPDYRNTQFILGGSDETAPQTEQRTGDGKNTVFVMSYPLAHEPTITLDTGGGPVAQTVGIGGIDSGVDWYWNAGKNEISQDSGGTPLSDTDIFEATYVGSFPVVVLSKDDAEIAAQLLRENSIGTGIIEDVAVDASLKTRAGAFQVAAGLLVRYAQLGRRLTFTTLRGGLKPGQMLTVTLPHFNLNADLLLIESVRITHHDKRFWYEVSALEGPINSTWVQFFAAMASGAKAVIDSINLGSDSTVTQLESFTATKTPSASFTATVQACPIFPLTFPVTLC